MWRTLHVSCQICKVGSENLSLHIAGYTMVPAVSELNGDHVSGMSFHPDVHASNTRSKRHSDKVTDGNKEALEDVDNLWRKKS